MQENARYEPPYDYVVYNDTVIEIIFSKQYVEAIKSFYRKTKASTRKDSRRYTS